MQPFEKTSLWRGAFAPQPGDEEGGARAMLKDRLLDLRRQAEHLVSVIIRDLPGMTVHDLTHLDALWETASLIAGEQYVLNPAEAFVFGAAVLLHDAAMSLAAFPDGLPALQKTAQWQDSFTSVFQAREGRMPTPDERAAPSDGILKVVVPEVLRELHAGAAEKLPFMEWPLPGGQRRHLIQDADFRSSYGSIIGKIAASHWWHSAELRRLPARVNAGPGVPAQWYVQPIKLACLLRVADATQIDHRRAPHFFRALLKPSGIADDHWNFQGKLGKPSADKQFIVYTGGPFLINDVESWWLCYDMLTDADNELRSAQAILDANVLQPFAILGVKGVRSPQTTAELITTEGWSPVNTELRVSDVPALVELLGGERLYGSNRAIALRELIQNAADAVRAKYLALGPNACLGNVHVRLQHVGDDWWLEVEDEGIGMSPTVLTGALLDFGRSFWRSPAVRREFPGLIARGHHPTGRYGIGFFSVFMLGDRVTVTSRRYDAAAADTHTLDFLTGLRVRPILREPEPSEAGIQPGTCVRVKLKVPPDDSKGILGKRSHSETMLETLNRIVARYCPGIDVTVEVAQNTDERECAVKANDWISQEPLVIFARASNGFPAGSILRQIAACVTELRDPDTNELFGRGCVYPGHRYSSAGVVTVGGFRAAEITGIAGLLVGESQTVSRDSALPLVPARILRRWASEQATLLANTNLSDSEKHRAASIVLALGGDSSPLPIAARDDEYHTAAQLRTLLASVDEVVVHNKEEITHEDDDDVTRRQFEGGFQVSPTLFLVPGTELSLVSAGDVKWPGCLANLFEENQARTSYERFEQLLTEVWGEVPESESDTRKVGDVDDIDINRNVTVYRRSSSADT